MRWPRGLLSTCALLVGPSIGLLLASCGDRAEEGPRVVDPGASSGAADGSAPVDRDRDDAGVDAPPPDAGSAHGERLLFDGTSTASWKMAGLGSFSLSAEGDLVAEPGDGLGLY